MEELLKLADDVYKQYESMESLASQHFEHLQQSMEEVFKNTMKDLASDLSPTQNKKKKKRLSVISDEESISSGLEDVKTLRPVRTARLNALKTLKESSIKNKMRQPVVSLERISNEENNKNINNQTPKSMIRMKQSKEQLLLNHNDIDLEKLNFNKDQTKNVDCIKDIASQNNNLEISNKKLDDSVVIKASLNIKQEKLSKGELDMMPPPAIPETKVKRTKKKVATDVKSATIAPIRNTRSRVKRELIEEQNATVSDAGTDDMGSQRKSAKVAAEEVNKSMVNSTIESIYEDADNGSNNMQSIIVLKRCDLQVSSEIQESDKLDATFISSAANSTSQNNTFIVSSNSKDKNMQKQPSKCDETFFVTSNLSSNACNAMSSTNSNEGSDKKQDITDATYSSILTKNTSKNKQIVEMAPPPSNLTKSKVPSFIATFIKSKNEIFNPFMQSPVKKKIEAFEQAAVDSMQCEIRIKTKAKTAVVNQESISIPEQVKQTEIMTNVEVKKKQDEKAITGCLLGTNLISKSSSKLAHIQKSLQIHQQKSSSSLALANSNSLTSLHTRENCVEDLKHALPLQTLEEKRRKREEKQRLALQLREAKDKEHREQTEKIIREREERVKKKQLEKERRAQHELLKKKALKEQVERRRQLEEINKKLRLQQQLQDEQRCDRELSENEYIEALKRENAAKDMIRLVQEKELLKLTLLKNKEKLAKERELKKSKIVKYDFDILASDDSTDEEGKQTSKKPAPPAWSRSIVRKFLIEQQTYIPSKLIDSFFSIAPMSPDLLDIFPRIDPKCLRRRSSAVWKTPPRYTLLPKY